MMLLLLLQSPLTDLSNNEDISAATVNGTAEAMIKDFVFLHGCKHWPIPKYTTIKTAMLMEMVYIPW